MQAKPGSTRKPIKVILDSNALFVPLQFRIDIFEELKTLLGAGFEPIVLSPILQELKELAEESSPKMRKDAVIALDLASKCMIVKPADDSTNHPDDVIVRVASDWKCPVFTNDKQLRKRLRDINVPVIYVRQKSRLETDGRL
jgi:rRNA-processing protein FCF1